jgi:hypothetical protein
MACVAKNGDTWFVKNQQRLDKGKTSALTLSRGNRRGVGRIPRMQVKAGVNVGFLTGANVRHLP